MKQILLLFFLGLSTMLLGQENVVIKGQVLNFDNSQDEVNFYRVHFKIYQPTFPYSQHKDQLFDINGLFEFSYKIDHPTIIEIQLHGIRKLSLAVDPGDTVNLKLDLSKPVLNAENLSQQIIGHSNYIIDSLLFSIEEKLSKIENIESTHSITEELIGKGKNTKQRFFIINHLAYKTLDFLPIEMDKDRFLIYYSLMEKYPDVFTYNEIINSILLKEKLNIDNVDKTINDSVIVINQNFDNISDLIENIKVRNKGKVIYIDIWATWCGPCKVDMKYKNKLGIDKFLQKKNVKSIYLCCRSSKKDWGYIIKSENIKGEHYFLNEALSRELFNEIYGVKSLPHYYLINKKGRFIENDNIRLVKRTDKGISINENFVQQINDLH